MSILRVEFIPTLPAGSLPASPSYGVTLPVSSDPTPADEQPVAPGDAALVRMTSDVPVLVWTGNVPKTSDGSRAYLMLPGQPTVTRVYPGQKIAAATADSYALYTSEQVRDIIQRLLDQLASPSTAMSFDFDGFSFLLH